MIDKAREQTKIDMRQAFLDAMTFSDIELTIAEIDECYLGAKGDYEESGHYE